MGKDILKDKVTINLTLEDGSLGSIHYFANGSKSFPKERIEVFCDGGIIQLDNFQKMKGYSWPGFNKMNLWKQDKGHKVEVKTFLESVRFGKQSPISIDELIKETRITIDITNSL